MSSINYKRSWNLSTFLHIEKYSVEMTKMTSKPYSRSNNGVRLPFAYLYLQTDGFYFFYLEGHPNQIPFVIPTKFQVLESCKPTSKKPPTIYIIFRNPVQQCLRELNLKFERKHVSKISSNLWRRIDSNLRAQFEKLYNDTIEEWRKGRLIIEFFKPLIVEPCMYHQTSIVFFFHHSNFKYWS